MYPLRFLVFVAIVSSAVIFGESHAASAQAKPPLVEEIRVVGYRRLAREEILSHISTRAGEAFNWDTTQHDFQALLALGLFDKLHSRVMIDSGLRGGVVVIFEVHELPVVASVKFYGLPNGVSEAEIIQELAAQQVNLGKGAVVNPLQKRKAIRIITRHLASHGWLDSGVDLSYENISSQSVAITIEISLRF